MNRTKFKTKHVFPDAINCSMQKDYTSVPNDLLRNPEISAKAKAILSLLLSNDDSWHTYLTTIMGMMKEGKDAIQSGLTELEEFGYLRRLRYRDIDTKRWVGTLWAYTDHPGEFNITTDLIKKAQTMNLEFPGVEDPQPGFPVMGDPVVENPPLKRLNNKKTNNKLTNSKNARAKTIPPLDERKREFRKQVFQFKSKYPKSLLQDFYRYWSEKNATGKKMRWEMQITFEIPQRLVTWKRKEKERQFPKRNNNTPKNTIGSRSNGSKYEYTKKVHRE